jgi:hypothetical protein
LESPTSATSSLAEFVRLYSVYWEVWPELHGVEKQQRQIGFELELCGTHDLQGHRGGTGCVGCKRAFQALRAIAEHILHPEGGIRTYTAGPFRPTLRYWAVPNRCFEVTLAVHVFYRDDFSHGVSVDDARLDGVKSRLRELAACEKQRSYVRAPA